jgi:hypothetical protein
VPFVLTWALGALQTKQQGENRVRSSAQSGDKKRDRIPTQEGNIPIILGCQLRHSGIKAHSTPPSNPVDSPHPESPIPSYDVTTSRTTTRERGKVRTMGSCRRGTRRRRGRGRTSRRRTAPASRCRTAAGSPPSLPSSPRARLLRVAQSKTTTRESAANGTARGFDSPAMLSAFGPVDNSC